MNIKKNVVSIFIIFILTTLLISNTVFGTLVDEFKNSIVEDSDATTTIKDEGGKILGIIRVIGTIASVAMLMILGIKYMLGSAEEKAEYKKSMLPYFIGAILIFAATNLADAIYEWVSKI